MAQNSKIEWTDTTWNPIAGCSKVSPACDNCYAEVMARRLAANPQTPWYADTIKDGKWSGAASFIPHVLEKPLSWKKPRRIFVCSMSDIFHESVPDEWVDKVFAVMALASQHTFLLLTKRPERMRSYILGKRLERVTMTLNVTPLPFVDGSSNHSILIHERWPLPNVWLGVTVENQATADERIPILLDTPAAKRFVSMEPLLGPVDIGEYLPSNRWMQSGYPMDAPLDWVIAGGESGPNARPSHPDWFRSLRDQCVSADVPFFFKQWGEWAFAGAGNTHFMDSDGVLRVKAGAGDDGYGAWSCSRVGKKAAGHLLDGQEWRHKPDCELKEALKMARGEE